ncbi:uncharacterized protein LOC123680207 [Harmonia axyridis]|uniref:uncharacterized protein LOC123680207 n=1 Tax=Harmonia axyridis TaxID=115357 RepID=UPI001E27832F|nr:uncharacterized protein LOC123680207 [Harmonia axyridis]
MGMERKKCATKMVVMNSITAYSIQILRENILPQHQFLRLKILGVKMEEKISVEEARAMKIMEETAKRVGNRWEIGLLWKEDDVKMPQSRSAAENRLKMMEKKLARNPVFSKEYLNKLDEYEGNGFARKVIDMAIQDEKSWYLPHFGVVNPKKPGKVRLVFDAASKVNGISLNEKLLKGPDFLNSLLGVLFKFRQKKIAFTGDIKDMFHRVYIREEDRKFQRQTTEYEMTVMIFGAASSPASAQFIMRKNAKEFEDEFPEAARVILEQHYMDDYLDSVDSVEEALDLITGVEEVHKRGGFQIRNWTSNSKEVLKLIPTEKRTRELKDVEIEKELPTERVLGLHWNPNEDCFLFKVEPKEIMEILEKKATTTKRKMLKIVMSVFDPLGFLCHFTVKARILLQEIWKMGSGWDDKLEHSVNEKWLKWLQDLRKIEGMKIPRCYLDDNTERKIQLHTFCDSSSEAYAAVSYFRILSYQKIYSNIVMAKSRVSPLKTSSIPRLELQGAVLGARLARTIRENHSIPISRQYFWTDSRTVISWLKSDPRKLKPFVSHRVNEILDISEENEWNWISTKDNVADEATRDNINCEWSELSRWNIGPSFLRCNEDTWFRENGIEIDKGENEEMEEFFREMKKEYVALTTEGDNLIESIPKIERFSSYLRLIRSTAWLLRAIQVFKGTIKSFSELLPDEVDRAEKLWFKLVQEACFREEIRSLKNKKPVDKTSRLYKLSPMLDSEGIVRINGRIGESEDICYETKFPIILDRKHYFTRLLILHYHKRASHQGQELVLNELRQKFWILQARAAVRSAWNSCYRCRNFRAKPIVPEMSPLPKCRVSAFVRPFTFTGMDYFGPMNVTIGRRHEKRYGVLFTCMSIRAIHLEIANSLTTDSTIMAIRRMIGRRGCPKKIFGDNGTNLKGAEREMKKALQEMNENQILAEMTTRGIEWVRIPPLTPHMGGCWERMVRSVKTALSVTLKERSPKEEVLSTLLIEAENIVNSRPLVHVPIDAADGEALTPNHFLIGTSSASPLPCLLSERDLVTRKQWKISQYFSDCFWKRWIREYLPTLTRRTKWHKKTKNLVVGDVVMIIDGDLPRNCWMKGVIEAVFVGKDGQVRSADVKTTLGTYRRPAVKLCPLDIQ